MSLVLRGTVEDIQYVTGRLTGLVEELGLILGPRYPLPTKEDTDEGS